MEHADFLVWQMAKTAAHGRNATHLTSMPLNKRCNPSQVVLGRWVRLPMLHHLCDERTGGRSCGALRRRRWASAAQLLLSSAIGSSLVPVRFACADELRPSETDGTGGRRGARDVRGAQERNATFACCPLHEREKESNEAICTPGWPQAHGCGGAAAPVPQCSRRRFSPAPQHIHDARPRPTPPPKAPPPWASPGALADVVLHS